MGESVVTIGEVLKGVELGSECRDCEGLRDSTCPAARLVLKIEGIKRFEDAREVDPKSYLLSTSDEYFKERFERFKHAVACCTGFSNVNHFVAHSLPVGNDSLAFNVLDLYTRGMAERAGIDPPLVYLDLPKENRYEPPEPAEHLRVAS